jgi:uncharacterized protein
MQFEQAGEFILSKLLHELPGNLTYHNIDHTLDVRNAAENIGLHENISAIEMKLLQGKYYPAMNTQTPRLI